MPDALSNLLENVRPRGALLDRSSLRSPWSLRFEEHAPLTLVTLLEGEGWIGREDSSPTRLGRGDVAIVVGPEPYTISDRPGAPSRAVVRSLDLCTAPGAQASSVLLKSTYQVEGSVCDRVLRGLPPLLVVAADDLPYPSIDMVVTELARPRAGRQAMLERLLDLLFVSTLREWLDRPDSGAPAWYRAQSDPVVGPALQLVHDDPAHPWTVAELAGEVAVSRATFARRFTLLVGEPPMSYLTCWRLCLAADLLRETDASVEAIAHQVGYANAYALSVAFKRAYGIRPTGHRTRSAPSPSVANRRSAVGEERRSNDSNRL